MKNEGDSFKLLGKLRSTTLDLNTFLLVLLAASVVLLIVVFFFIDDVSTISRFVTRSQKPAAQVQVIGKDEITEDNEFFKITHLVVNKQYIVLIKKGPVAESKRKAEDLLKKKLATANLCTFKVNFVSSKEISGEFKLKDTVATGCPEPSPFVPVSHPASSGSPAK